MTQYVNEFQSNDAPIEQEINGVWPFELCFSCSVPLPCLEVYFPF